MTEDPPSELPSVFDRRITVLIAVIAVVATLLGAVVGGFATYLGNRSLEAGRSRNAARGAARALTSRMTSVRLRLDVMLELRRLLPIDAAFRISLPLEDSKLIASNVSAGQWAVVADTLAALETFASQDTLEGLKDANVALQPLVRSG